MVQLGEEEEGMDGCRVEFLCLQFVDRTQAVVFGDGLHRLPSALQEQSSQLPQVHETAVVRSADETDFNNLHPCKAAWHETDCRPVEWFASLCEGGSISKIPNRHTYTHLYEIGLWSDRWSPSTDTDGDEDAMTRTWLCLVRQALTHLSCSRSHRCSEALPRILCWMRGDLLRIWNTWNEIALGTLGPSLCRSVRQVAPCSLVSQEAEKRVSWSSIVSISGC